MNVRGEHFTTSGLVGERQRTYVCIDGIDGMCGGREEWQGDNYSDLL